MKLSIVCLFVTSSNEQRTLPHVSERASSLRALPFNSTSTRQIYTFRTKMLLQSQILGLLVSSVLVRATHPPVLGIAESLHAHRLDLRR